LKTTAKILAFYFLLGSLFPNTDFSQLAKVLNLCEHFNEHKKDAVEQSVSLMDFLADHYANQGHQHSNDSSHQNLPLYQLGHSVDFVVFHLPAITLAEQIVPNKVSIACAQAISTDYSVPVFQPPMA
jgi:hypothetical protein